MRALPSTAFASVLIGAIAALSAPADAACKKFGFTVNDYGKDGPTNDAKNLLDKHIAEWATQNGVGEYSTGKKNVSCELFLDVILFDEHTCTASATVCWGPDAKKLGTTQQSAAAPAATDEASGNAPPAPVRKAHALGEAPAQAAAAPAAGAATEAAAAPAAEAPAASSAQMDAAPTQPVEQIAAPADAPPIPLTPSVQATTTPPAAAAPSAAVGTTGAVVETGALQAGQALPMGTNQTTAPKAPAVPEKDRAAAAAAAASAAAAAERAAMAAETAANAAKEAAAAAVAASAASKGGAMVPPLDHASGAKPVHSE